MNKKEFAKGAGLALGGTIMAVGLNVLMQPILCVAFPKSGSVRSNFMGKAIMDNALFGYCAPNSPEIEELGDIFKPRNE